jgi:hypothetical protein
MDRRRSLACFKELVLTEMSPWLLAAARRERTWSLVGGAAMSVRVLKERVREEDEEKRDKVFDIKINK